jgi:hypothetical protein
MSLSPVPAGVVTATTAAKASHRSAAQRSVAHNSSQPAKAQSKPSQSPVKASPLGVTPGGGEGGCCFLLCVVTSVHPKTSRLDVRAALPFWISLLDCTCHPGTFRLNEMCTSTCLAIFHYYPTDQHVCLGHAQSASASLQAQSLHPAQGIASNNTISYHLLPPRPVLSILNPSAPSCASPLNSPAVLTLRHSPRKTKVQTLHDHPHICTKHCQQPPVVAVSLLVST